MNIEGDHDPAVDRPPLIFLHGFTLSSEDWKPLLPYYTQDFQPVAIDLIGHGKSDAPVDLGYYSMVHCVEQVAGLLAQIGISSAHWIGYSMGGRVLLSLAKAYPELVNSMVLESTTPGIANDRKRAERLKRDRQMARFIRRNPIDAFVERWMNHPIFESQGAVAEEKLEKARQIRLHQSSIGLANSLEGMGRGAMPHLWEDLQDMVMPILLITGELDKSHIETHVEMAHALPKTQSVVVEDAGHNIHFERPTKFVEITGQFYREIDE
ncbi:MAG: 2-succinyl-6-hydroxy-2,4-cyclohexadiene-1-carboxylate synthase [Candidatus Marinimicrobia bacterium]|nr:2-succinyl-6-hydroxy-2,4-cyclohexadiene-1-carboxylate synthase [Candidatus Neomarinimicrobiota bacterium]MCF7828228.1 2-succinyl-6-hydroxy-2,4-cyclohexadiene-1-carboxylate synthase [Candidatus Neomarinimicrobiota bacterium]MCF7879597.1 2-succinyl-6-hydroxy-2,4-cyclohexadiene-1-carboxylate synthase [Candidatus Neomarinimicrobiota bacterium]